SLGGGQEVQVISAEKVEKIERLLKVANAHARVGRLIMPAGSNAYDAYQIVLTIDPNNREAKAGIDEVRQKYLVQTLVTLNAGDSEQARSAEEAGLMLFTNVPVLMNLNQ